MTIRSHLYVSFVLPCLLGASVALLVPQPATALQSAIPAGMDSRIKEVEYNENEVYKFVGHYGYQSIIEFGQDEEIMTVSLGDSVAWQVSPTMNKLFVKPVEQDALTNMTVITTRGMYHFELHSRETTDIQDKKMIFVMRFVYTDDDVSNLIEYTPDILPDLEDPLVRKNLNFKYTISGTDVIAPLRIFDDGEFTYMEFKDINGTLPAIYYVNSDQSEGLVNYRKKGNYLVIDRVWPRFTLRNGTYVLCVFNEAAPPLPVIEPTKEGISKYLPF